MTPEELLKPRYKLTVNYPGCKWKIGEVFTYSREIAQTYDEWTLSDGSEIITSSFGAYPHLFKPLEWWEHRKPEDMPQYIKDKNGVVAKISWKTGEVEGYEPNSPVFYIGWKPATESEYLSNTTKQP